MTNDDASDTRRVLPSGADFATYSAPMIWFAPGLFSTMTGWPRSSERRAPSWGAGASGAPPGGGGGANLAGRERECWAETHVKTHRHDRGKKRAKRGFPALPSSS